MAIHPGLGRKKAWADAGCLLVTFCNSSLVAKVNVSEVPFESNSVADTLTSLNTISLFSFAQLKTL